MPKDAPPPLIMILPSEPTPGLFLAFQRLSVLTGLTTSERAKGGSDAYDHMLRQATQSVRDELTRLIGDRTQYIAASRPSSAFVAALALRSSLSTLSSYSLNKVLDAAYTAAYRHAPKPFFTQYKSVSNSNLKNAVKQVATILFAATPEVLGVALTGLASDLRDKYLMQAWGILTKAYVVRPPTASSLMHGWKYLDTVFPAGGAETRLAQPLMALLNAPFGYDYNTVTLLFAAWFAHYHHDLTLYAQGRTVGVALLQEQVDKGPKDFLQAICGVHAVSLKRRDPDDTRKYIKTLVNTAHFTLAEAETALVDLKSFADDERNQSQEREAAQAKAAELGSGVEVALAYVQRATEIELQAKHSSDVPGLVTHLDGLRELPKLSLVTVDAPPAHSLRTLLVTRLGDLVNAQTAQLERPSDTSQVGLHRSRLDELRAAVESAELPDLVARVKAALSTLEAQASALDRRQQETVYLQRINAVSLTSNLSTLREAHAELVAYQIQTPDIARARDKKVAELTATIQQHEQFIRTLPAHCAAVSSRRSVDKLRDDIMRHQARFIGSDHEKLLADSLSKMDGLRAFFDELDDFRGQLPQSQADYERIMRRFEALGNQYKSELSAPQLGLLSEVEQQTNNHVADSQDRARLWLKQNSVQARSGVNPTHIAQQLSRVPPFFPEALREELQNLRAEVQARIDSDAILKVEQAFRTIVGREKQEECLRRLAQLVQASTGERVTVKQEI